MHNEIHEELNNISPELAALQKTNPFTVPPEYFEYLPNTIQQRLGFSVNTLKAENPFEVPTGYFDTLPLRIAARVSVNNSALYTTWRDWLASLLNPKLSATLATLLLLFALGLWHFNPKNIESHMNLPTAEDIQASGFLTQIDEDFLVEAYAAQPVSSSEQDISGKAIEDYLINNQIEYSQIANEL